MKNRSNNFITSINDRTDDQSTHKFLFGCCLRDTWNISWLDVGCRIAHNVAKTIANNETKKKKYY